LHQSVARVACHALVRVSAARCAAETRRVRKVQDLSFNTSFKWVVVKSGYFHHRNLLLDLVVESVQLFQVLRIWFNFSG
jgi:hypothetical protein